MANSITGFQLAQSGVDLSKTSGAASVSRTSDSNSPALKATGIPTYRYPNKAIKESDDYLEIRVVKYTPPGTQSIAENNVSFKTTTQVLNESPNIKTPVAIITLPMPQDIQDSNSVDWGDSSLNAIEATTISAAMEGMKAGDPFSGGITGINKMLSAFRGTAATGNAQDLAQSYFAAQLVQVFNSNVDSASLLSRSTGQVLNPNLELLFKGVGLREFSFNFDFAPKSPDEAKVIKDIIRTFKKGMSPRSSAGTGVGAGLFISAPNIFVLEYKSGGKPHPFLNKFKPMAMKGMGVNYTGSGTYSVYSDSTPVHMKLTLTFQEVNPIYFEDYQDSDVGVGY